MRDLIVTILVAGSLPLILRRPWIGVLVWSWLGYMNPHRLTWGFAYDFPFAQLVAIVTLISIVIHRERFRFPVNSLIVFWLLFIVWMNVTTFFALVPDDAWLAWDRAMKIQLFSIITLILMQDRMRIDYLVWTIVICLGFFGVKGGLFSILTGGNYIVWGPKGSFIEGNNSLGLAMIMTMPLMWYLSTHTERKLVRYALWITMGLTALAILTTHSRGALLAITGMLVFLWLKSRHKTWLAIALLIAAPILWFSMPSDWHDRMGTIRTYQEDGSAMGRINAWWFAYHIANDNPVTGGGFDVFTPELFQRYAPDPDAFHDSHSIYFEVLAEHGYIGLILFLAIGAIALRMAGKVAREGRATEGMTWAGDLAAMLQASLIGYAVGGAFLGLAYFDLYYHLVVMVLLLRLQLSQHAAKARATASAEADRRSSVAVSKAPRRAGVNT